MLRVPRARGPNSVAPWNQPMILCLPIPHRQRFSVLVVSKGTGYVLERTRIHRPQQLCGLHLRLQRDEFVVKCKLRFVGGGIENSLYFFLPSLFAV